jgi:hypothetical protein
MGFLSKGLSCKAVFVVSNKNEPRVRFHLPLKGLEPRIKSLRTKWTTGLNHVPIQRRLSKAVEQRMQVQGLKKICHRDKKFRVVKTGF